MWCRLIYIAVGLACFLKIGRTQVTPEVSILEESPSRRSGRVIELPDRRVIINGLLGETIVMECRVFNMPPNARIYWRNGTVNINNGLMSRDTSKWKIGQGKQTNSIRLEIMSLDKTYTGSYTCECYYSGEIEAARAPVRELRVYAKPRITVYKSSYDTSTKEGEKVILKCDGSGDPSPVIFWRRTGGESSIIRNHGVIKMGTSITFEKAQPEDAGEYMCFVENKMGKAIWRIQLKVTHTPNLRVFPESGLAKQKPGCSLQLLCVISANPNVLLANVHWTSSTAGTMKDDGKRIKVRYLNAANNNVFYSLDFEPIEDADFNAVYTCSATNTNGVGSKSVSITRSSIAYPSRTGGVVCSAHTFSISGLTILVLSIGTYITKNVL